DFGALQQLAAEESDPVARAHAEKEVGSEHDRLLHQLEEFELRQFLSGESDRANAFLTIHSGAGGTESCDWADMLLRMYQRWIERSGFTSQTIDIQTGDEVGIKSVTLLVSGEYAFGYLSAERGQGRNRELAMKMLKAKLYQIEQDKKRAEIDRQYGEKGEIAWGSQIRSYVFQPYQMVKDHRTGAETSDVQGVMDGGIDLFIQAKLRGQKSAKGADKDEV